MHTNETPDEERNCGEVSASEVPINHMMDINDSDSDFDDTSDDDNDRDYELLATQDVPEGVATGQSVFYPHSYHIEWVDWNDYEQSLQQTNSGQQTVAEETAVGSDPLKTEATLPTADSATAQTNKSSEERIAIALNDGMTRFVDNLWSNPMMFLY